jgi:thiopeptide-type bacteriocin biosynthesis protein
MAAAEAVFAADSRTLLGQFAEPCRPDAPVCAAAQFVAIAISFTGSTAAGMRWLIDHAPRARSAPRPRDLLADAVRLTDPSGDWAALRAAFGGDQIVSAWKDRGEALAAYRASLATDTAIDPDAVLIALLHAHHIRAVGIDRDDEARCLGLARAAALAWTARAGGDAR